MPRYGLSLPADSERMEDMPIVKVRYRSPVFEITAKQLANELPRIVALALTCDDPNGSLDSTDVEVEVEPMKPGLHTNYDLHIEVEANEYTARRKNLEERCHQILIGVRFFFNRVDDWKKNPPKGWVWVKLFPAYWEEI